jgi:glycosyltransferase involved in cell wall biosynthesis
MAQPKLRVLVDLSMALRGYCGIAQDVRLLYKMLALCPDVEVTGLVYHPRKFSPLHTFLRPDAARADRLANQASFLWALSEAEIKWPDLWPLRALKQLHYFAKTFCTGRAHWDRLDTETFWSVIWRLLFSPTLSPHDLPLVREGDFRLSNLSNGMVYGRALLKGPPIKLDTRGYDFFIVQGSRPFRISPGTRQIVRHHDMIPVREPDTISSQLFIEWHHKAIRQSPSNAFYVCNSEPTRDDLTAMYPELKGRSTTIPCMLSDAYHGESNPDAIRPIIDLRRSAAAGVTPGRRLKRTPRYILSVATLEPRKNFVGLIRAFNALKVRSAADARVRNLKLVIVGSPGWKYEPILAAMRDMIRRGQLIHLENVAAEELRLLYTHAEAFVFPSMGEGFGIPPLEAMRCETPVVASDVPAHRWVLGDAALYCDPYDVAAIASTIQRLVASDESDALRDELVARGRERTKLYSLERCSRQWRDLLYRLKYADEAGTRPGGESRQAQSVKQPAVACTGS